MKISARVNNRQALHEVTLETSGKTHTLDIAPRATGFGSSVNGGELLFLALATCYCNDLYREAARRGLSVSGVEVEVEGDFPVEGQGASNVTYRVKVVASGDEAALRDLAEHTDRVTEIQNTLRVGTPVLLSQVEITHAVG